MPKKHVPKKETTAFFFDTLIINLRVQKTSRLGKVPVVLDEGGNPRPVRRQFFAQPVVPQESDSTVGWGGDMTGTTLLSPPTKVKVNAFSHCLQFNTPPSLQTQEAALDPTKNLFRYTHTHIDFFGGMWGWFFGGPSVGGHSVFSSRRNS